MASKAEPQQKRTARMKVGKDAAMPTDEPIEARPNVVTVGGVVWQIEWYDSAVAYQEQLSIDGMNVNDAHDALATTDNWERVIRVRCDGVSIGLQQENLLHEILHACWFAVRADGTKVKRDMWEEHLISGIDQPLLVALRDNPGVVAWLLGGVS